MEGKYIFAIIVLAAFFLLILISFAFLEYGRIKENRLQAWIDERYADKDLNKYDYDTVSSEEEVFVRSVQAASAESEGGKESDDTALPVPDKIEVEGIEEITGNYEGG